MAPQVFLLANLQTVQERLGNSKIKNSIGFLRESCGQAESFNRVIAPLVRGVLQDVGEMEKEELTQCVASFSAEGPRNNNVNAAVRAIISTLLHEHHLVAGVEGRVCLPDFKM